MSLTRAHFMYVNIEERMAIIIEEMESASNYYTTRVHPMNHGYDSCELVN